ncbi:MAG: hypothetical protein JEZ03_16565 [Bacteroidales bacterium]|nr:hypothetical protein [Bacteroidales bacterium]
MDAHRDFIMITGVTKELELSLRPHKVAIKEISDWVKGHLTSKDGIEIEVSSSC